MSDVGFTTSIPVEILFAAGRRPVDLNNVFISRPDAASLVLQAERRGFPSTCCAWIKGIYGVLLTTEIREVIGVVRGDCSQTQGLMEIVQMEGLRVIPFAYPYDRSPHVMDEEIAKMRACFRVEPEAVHEAKRMLDRIRGKLQQLDRLTWEENRVTGQENHRFLLASTDMKGDPPRFEREIDHFLEEAGKRSPLPSGRGVRLGVLGVPPIWYDFYERIERDGIRIVFNEVQRQFSMPYSTPDLVRQYTRFTYPYDVFFRLEDIMREGERRGLDGYIHYVQSFCFRQIEDRILRESLPLPVLTLEGDRPEPMDLRTQTRIEAFLEMLSRNQESRETPRCHAKN